ncbi:MAG: hypothetical protein M3P18_19295 [Actinomycetota bacterium]|nr:hypothetical protein [Actinomycetota bacterium]
MKRIAFGLVVVSLVLGLGRVAAARADTSVDTFPVQFVLSSATCAELPSGTTITGSGTLKSVTNQRTDQNGVTTVINSSHARGTATDQDGNVYTFSYSNEFHVSDTADDPGLFSGLMTDQFLLEGKGPLKVNNGFVVELTTDLLSLFEVEDVIQFHGDPLDFAAFTTHCDPL